MAAKSASRDEYDSKVAADVRDERRRELKVEAAKQDKSMAELIREALDEYLENDEDDDDASDDL